MVNNIENNKSLNGMSDLEHNKNAVEMMRYRPNKFAASLVYGGLVFIILASFICLNSMKPNDWQVLAYVLLLIVILLVGFLCSELVKAYSVKGSITLFVIGGLTAANMFWIPVTLLTYYNKWISAKDAYNAAVAAGKSQDTLNELNAEVNDCANHLGSTITSSTSSTQIRWLTDNGNARAIVAIIFFAIAAAFFIAAGVIGFAKARKLNAYLESINVKK